MNKEEIEACDEETMIMPSAAFGPATPIISVRNNIYFYDEVNTTVTRALISAMYEMALDMANSSITSGYNPVPINLHINSYGGNVSDALAIVQCIKNIQNGEITKVGNIKIPIEVNTYIEGEADSAGSLIACVGTKRYMSKYSLSLVHEVRQIGGSGGKAEDIDIQAQNLAKFRDIFKEIYLEHSKMTPEQYDKLIEKENYSTPKELLELGLIDEII